jgi:hypothetical protein
MQSHKEDIVPASDVRRLSSIVIIAFMLLPFIGSKTTHGQLIDAKQKQLDAEAQRLAFGAVEGNFESSLDMREAADFLLTPALLEQESISTNIVITYPME